MCDTLTKKVSIPALEREKNNVFSLERCQNRQLYNTSKQCFIFLFLASNVCVLSIPFFNLHRGEKTSEDTRDSRRGTQHTTTRGCGGRRGL
ncbi:hypothetical protein AB205_0121810 [Aquarana catesbeiana]|uniref:Transmembrane protein n=1 Tax=Aquarana catesbeiana TaxID=8400 RepID=A0A2G9SN34_AQUCT|nr:hypothetical protein AB205_0121810 [Aquarana catesbeiana]